jgi:hypothetical protein
VRLASLSVLALWLFSAANTFADGKISDEDLERFFGESAPYREIFQRAKTTISEGDRAGFAELILYPFTVYREKDECCGSEAVSVLQDKKAFLEQFDKIVTPRIKQLILDQRFDDLSIDWRGLGYELGVVWIGGRCLNDDCTDTHVGIAAINTDSAKYLDRQPK